MNRRCLHVLVARCSQRAVASARANSASLRVVSLLVSSGVTFAPGQAAPLVVLPQPQAAAPVVSAVVAADPKASLLPSSPQAAVAQATTAGNAPEPPGPRNKVEVTSRKKGQPSVYGTVTKPGLFVLLEQTSAWTFRGTGNSWGTGAGAGATFLGFGVNGNIRGDKDNLLSWSAQLGPLFQHTYSVPGNDATPLRMDVSAFLSPLQGDSLSIYAIWRGVAGLDVANQTRLVNTVRSGIVYSFAGSRIIPDAVEEINLPERGFYVRAQPSWFFNTSGQLTQVQTQAYLGLSESWYPFTFAVEVGPEFIQAAGRELQTNLGSFFDFGYILNPKTRAYLRYRPSLSFGGSVYPAAGQVFQAGVNYRF